MLISEAADAVKWEYTLINKTATPVAMLNQITCQINSAKDAKIPSINSFLPYPQVSEEEFDCPVMLSAVILNCKGKLSGELQELLGDPVISNRIYNTYYWGSGAFLYG